MTRFKRIVGFFILLMYRHKSGSEQLLHTQNALEKRYRRLKIVAWVLI